MKQKQANPNRTMHGHSGVRSLNFKAGIRALFLVLLVALCALFHAQAQVGNASLNGQAQDPSGAVIAGVHITALNLATGVISTTTSNDAGIYLFPALPPGSYTITAEQAGFERNLRRGVTLTVGQSATINITMKLGSASETVTVEGDTGLVNTSSAEISQVVNERSVKELPLNGRDPASLVLLSAGITNVLQAAGNAGISSFNGESLPDESGASAGGGRQGSTYYLLDGSPNMDTYMLLAAPFPNADATQEFRVVSNNFDAQYGFSPGAVVSIATKSGTNSFHGGVFEFLRNDDLNAGNYFTHAVDPLKRNQFGGYVGGPILRNKLFFFANYQATRASSQSSTNVAFTPTAAMLNGDFSAVPITLGGPFATVNGKPNQVDPSLFSPGALALTAAALPLGQVPSTGQVTYAAGAVQSSYDEGTGRIDYTINHSQQLAYRSFIQYFNQPQGGINGDMLATSQGMDGSYFNEAVNHSWTISPSLVNVASVFWTQLNDTTGAESKDSDGNPICLSRFVNIADPPGTCFIVGLNVSNGFGSGYNISNRQRRTTYGLTDNVTMAIKRHTLTFGANVMHQFSQENSAYPSQAMVSFTGYITGFGLADYLLGDAYNLQQGAGEISSVRGWQIGLYAQDQYKIFSNLTLTAGLRWDPNTPPSVARGRGAAYVAGQQSQRFPNAPLGMIFPGDPGLDDALMPTHYAYFEPRIGLAWQPYTRTSVRAAFGMFEAPLPYSYYNHAADISPFSPTYTINGTPQAPLSFDNPWTSFPGGVSPFPPFASLSGAAPPTDSTFITPVQISASFSHRFNLGMTQSWNLSIDQQFTPDIALHLTYVGSQSYHQTVAIDRNPGIMNVRSLTDFGQILEDDSFGTASYHSLQVGIEKKLKHSLQFQSNFTWSKIIDTASTGNISQGGTALPDPFNISWNRGISDLNVPLVSVSNFVYTTPTLRGWNPIARAVLGDWEISGIWTFQSGVPFGIQGGDGNNNSGALQNSGQYGDRADVTGQPYEVHQGGRQHWLNAYFNPAAFQPNAIGTFGNSGKNIFIGPGINSADMGLIKNWQLAGVGQLQFRWEMFNAFNHPSFGLPNTVPNTPSTGQITTIGAIPPRVMQGALKISF